jgi:cell division protein FtsB
MVAKRGKSLAEQLRALCNQVGSYHPRHENFRLTPEVKAKFTEKLGSDPKQTMDFRVKNLPRFPTRFPSRFPRPEDGLRAMVERAPQAEALAASWADRVRPWFMSVYVLRRRIATIFVVVVTVSLFAHVVFGANGMIVYKQKRAEYESLHLQLQAEQAENERYAREIEALKKDDKAIEKEAREQLGYAKPGEYVYVAPAPPKPAPQANRTARK